MNKNLQRIMRLLRLSALRPSMFSYLRCQDIAEMLDYCLTVILLSTFLTPSTELAIFTALSICALS